MSNPQLDPEDPSGKTSGDAPKTRPSANGGSVHSGSIAAETQPISSESSDGGLTGFAWTLACMFAIGLMVSGWSAIQEGQRAKDIESQMRLLAADLEASNLELAAQQEAMGPIRDQVEQIVASVGHLQALVATEADEVGALSAVEETLPEAVESALAEPVADSGALEGVVEPAETGVLGAFEETLFEGAETTLAAPAPHSEALEGVVEPTETGVLGAVEDTLFEEAETTLAAPAPDSEALEGVVEPAEVGASGIVEQ